LRDLRASLGWGRWIDQIGCFEQGGDGDGHAVLARVTESRFDERIHGLVHVGVRHDDHVLYDDHVLLVAAERLATLVVSSAVPSMPSIL
jgi:hypothetical protein